MESRTPSRKLADLLLGGDGALETFVRDRRREGKAWRLIERELWTSTDGEVDLTYETLRSWFPDEAVVK